MGINLNAQDNNDSVYVKRMHKYGIYFGISSEKFGKIVYPIFINSSEL